MIPIKSFLLLASVLSTTAVQAADTTPNIIPAPQSWTASPGHFDITSATLTCPDNQRATLKPILEQFRQDLTRIGISVHEKPPTIAFVIQPADNGSSPEQYTLTIKSDRIMASPPTPTGLFYASQSLLQLAMQSSQIPCGTIIDYPDYRKRALMLDVGRKFFPYETLKDYIRSMGFLKLNELHLHLSDNSFGAEIYPGFRIECETLPELTNKDGFYTKTQIRELQTFARLRGIDIVPEIDAPGHAYCFTRLRPDLRHPKLGKEYLDVTNPQTVELMKAIFDEFIPLFDSPYVHIGTDEYRRGSANKEEWAELGEGFRQYINTMNRYIRAKHGKTVRIWSGWEHMPGTTQPDTDIVIDMWVSSDAKTKSADGYKYINSNHGRTYIVPGAGYYGVSNGGLYNGWTPAVFTGNKEKDPEPDDPNLLGGKLHIWNDMGPNGYTMYEIANLAVPTLFVMGEKMWGTKGSADYTEFQKRIEPLQAIPDVRLLQRQVRASDPETGLVFDSGKTLYTLKNPGDSIPLLPYLGGAGDESKNIEFPWTVSMQIKPAAGVEQAAPATILGSRIAELQADLRYTSTKKDPKTTEKTKVERSGLGFSRLDKYTSRPLRSPTGQATREASQVVLPEGKFSTLTFVGTRRATTIYIDGKQVAQFSGTRAQALCPLDTIGAHPGRGGGFVGEIKNLKIYDRAIDKHAIARLAGFELPVNIALDCKVTATRSDIAYNLIPEKLTDGDTSSRNSRWSSGSTRDPAEIIIDLGKTRTVNGASLHWEAAFPNDYTIELSTNGKTFRPALKANGKSSATSHKIKPTQARYVRINMEDPTTQWGYSLYEVEIFGK